MKQSEAIRISALLVARQPRPIVEEANIEGTPMLVILGNASMSRKDSHASRSSSKKPRRNVPKSSSCDGLGMVDARFERLCASSGISVPPTQVARSRSISLTSPGSPFLN
jgi:hypothetical protein